VTALEQAQKLKAKFGDLISEPKEFRGEITVKVADAQQIAVVCEFAKKQLGFTYLVDISSVDNYGEDPRWTVVYHLRNIVNGLRFALRLMLVRKNPSFQAFWCLAHLELARTRNLRHDGHCGLLAILICAAF
jgi:NADH-quinone oxidoreductase subunit C